jgi:membrane-bound ClpP family serine protease
MHASADVAFGAMTLGMFLIYIELCAPGLVVPGSLGAIGVLGGGWLLWEKQLALPGVLSLAAGLAFMIAAVRLRSYRLFTALALFCFCLGSWRVVDGPDSISPLLCVPVSLVWGAVTIALGRLASKAHANKKHRSSTI